MIQAEARRSKDGARGVGGRGSMFNASKSGANGKRKLAELPRNQDLSLFTLFFFICNTRSATYGFAQSASHGA